ncbi:hypothetical protein NLM27_27135 [Bradyrhizobium sp. CCGB12]|uniref:hypothetical protein n=1 Tax=Bradyrhizobium sp. CCGB12 TaxID=2949632 RepID=UPI0020B1B211|nr:hypothetical protein [Bradyrhizobium sp. CCGB12]MCP3392425.1 hypothetical protein [Bradyrhizobium sp. CCGB12]
MAEIDAQKLIKASVTGRRSLSIGCRFHVQPMRIYAWPIAKHSAGVHYPIVDPQVLSRNDLRSMEISLSR